MSHTKGPWETRYNKIVSRHKKGNGKDSYSLVIDLTNKANARLIAAAPELLKALTETLSRIDQWDNDEVVGPIILQAQQAIKKAKG